MGRLTKKPGDVFALPLSEGRVGYAQWLPDDTARIFLAAHTAAASVQDVLALPVAFRVMVFKDTPGRYNWSKLGNAAIPATCLEPQQYAMKDQMTGRISVYFNGQITPADIEQVRGLETCAAWAHPHIAERLEAQLNGAVSAYLDTVRVA